MYRQSETGHLLTCISNKTQKSCPARIRRDMRFLNDCLWDEISTSQFKNHDGFSVSKLRSASPLSAVLHELLFGIQVHISNPNRSKMASPPWQSASIKMRAVAIWGSIMNQRGDIRLTLPPSGRQLKWWLLFLSLPSLRCMGTARECTPRHMLRFTCLHNWKSMRFLVLKIHKAPTLCLNSPISVFNLFNRHRCSKQSGNQGGDGDLGNCDVGCRSRWYRRVHPDL